MKDSLVRNVLVPAIIILFVLACIVPSIAGTIIEEYGLQDNKTPFIDFNPSSNTLYVGGNGSGNYTNIQDAIDDASDGDTVFVYDDLSPYNENLVVDKSISLIGEDGNTTIIDGNNLGNVVYISADGVNISKFTIQNCGSDETNAGIRIYSVHNVINDNNINSNNMDGIYLYFSSENIISNNSIRSNGDDAVALYESNNNTISNNIISFNDGNGIIIYYPSNNNYIFGNTIRSNNADGVHINSSDNYVYHNNFIHNLRDGYGEVNNTWDNDFFSGGNYWYDYTGEDYYHGSNQDIPGHDRIGDTPYKLPSKYGTDFYPVMYPNGWLNEEPENISIQGPTYGRAGVDYTYNSSADDSNGDPIYYKFDWSDGFYSDWLGPYPSGTEAFDNHSWNVGVFDIKVKAKDTRGWEMDWSEPYRITMPKNKATYNRLFLQFLERFQIMERLLSLIKMI
jgi:parallel beta-helix repeat protein